MKMYRQGDVLIIQVAKPPKGDWKKQKREGGRVILAAGEATGHHHAIRTPGVCMLRAEGISDAVLTVAREALLEHEEHATIILPPGTYVRRIQREWDGAASKQVVD